MPENVLQRFEKRLTEDERAAVLDGRYPVDVAVVRRQDGSAIGLEALDDLMMEFRRRRDEAKWADDRATSDRWLAPRVHFAVRLTRQLASDRRAWEWLALRYADEITWRWAGSDGTPVTGDHWYGPVHKQAIARLWWGAELFRNGADYGPVERAFVRQDLINSYLHRPLVRCRSLALGILDVLAPSDDSTVSSSGQVNDLARVLNFATAGSPPELETGLQQDDFAAYLGWAGSEARIPQDWDVMPTGPLCADTTPESLLGGLEVARRGWGFASAG